MGDYRTQGERPSYPAEPVEPPPSSAPRPALPAGWNTTRVVVRRVHPIVIALLVVAPTLGALSIGGALAGRTTLRCVRAHAGAVPRCVGEDQSLYRPLREEFELRADDDVRALELDHGESTELVLALPRAHLRAGVVRREVGEIAADVRAFLHDGQALRFERSRTILVAPLVILLAGLLGSGVVRGLLSGPTTLTLDLERRRLLMRRRGPWWRRPWAEEVVFDFSGAKFVRTSPREIDDSGWEKLVLDDGVAREVVIGSPSTVRDASRTLNEALRADYAKRGKVPEELSDEIAEQRRRDEAIASFRFDD